MPSWEQLEKSFQKKYNSEVIVAIGVIAFVFMFYYLKDKDSIELSFCTKRVISFIFATLVALSSTSMVMNKF